MGRGNTFCNLAFWIFVNKQKQSARRDLNPRDTMYPSHALTLNLMVSALKTFPENFSKLQEPLAQNRRAAFLRFGGQNRTAGSS